MPKSFCREIVEAKGTSNQLALYMAVVLGFKPLLDDVVARKNFSLFLEACKSYNLHVRPNVIMYHRPKGRIPPEVLGRENICTTSAYGLPLDVDFGGGVHVYVSKDRDLLRHGMWYPVIIRNRVMTQPYADTLRYGRYLGYPSCCIEFFRHFNNWNRYSFLYEIYKNSSGRFRYLCNPLGRDRIYSYIGYMPCSFSCEATISMVGRLRQEIKKREPDFVELVDAHLKLPYLVFRERKFYAFLGEIKDGGIAYSKVFFPDFNPEGNIYQELLEQGDLVKIEGRTLFVYRRGDLIARKDIPLTEFGPEYPFVIQFS